MTNLNSRASVSIFQIVFFTPALIAATLLCIKHGFGRSSGWFFILTVSLFRIAGGATQLATYSTPSEGLYEASAILGSFGLSALILASSGFLARANDSINQTFKTVTPPFAFRLVQLITTVGLIVSIVGYTNVDLNERTRTVTLPPETKAGVIILLVALILVLAITLRTISSISHVLQPERLLVWSVLGCLPFILVRLVYAILAVFLNDSNFSIIFPSTVILWTLSTIEECFVVFIYLLVGFQVPKLAAGESQQQQEAFASQKTPHANTINSTQGPGLQSSSSTDASRGGIRWRGSIILTLIGAISDLFANRKGKAGSAPAHEMRGVSQRRQQQQSGMMGSMV